ncbi:hypothetical protein CLOSCI_01113 [[Clostridium] scindens ATCC 35704]|nr:hypothetical protein CLOSCI_01113 [[Clostridium] scindens ATCC 35704]
MENFRKKNKKNTVILLIFYTKVYIIYYIWQTELFSFALYTGCIIYNKDNKGGETLARN